MLILRPYIFNNFPDIVCGFSTKLGLNRKAPFYFNMSYNVGDESVVVDENRKEFLQQLGLDTDAVCYQKQVHGDNISIANKPGNYGESDALITTSPGLGLVISSADCPAIFIFDCKKKVVAAVHSGWRSTSKKILKKTLIKLRDEFGSKGENLICYISPSISQLNYEVGEEVAAMFNAEYIRRKNNKCFLDLKKANTQMLLDFGVKKNNLQISKLCTYEYSLLLHSYRREGNKAGRAIGVIAMRGKI